MRQSLYANQWFNLLLVGLILLINFLHFDAYGGRNYREDEINSVHGALTKNPSEIVKWMSTDLHPPGWRLLADFWVDSFGTAENIVRWSSTLINMLTFALIFQLGKQVVDWRTGLFSVALLGVYAVVANAMNELRPYPMLIMLTTALHLVFYRWLHFPDGKHMVLYVVLGIIAMYTHFFAVFVFATHIVFFVVFVRFQKEHWWHSFAMWFFIGLSFLGWIIPFVHTITVPFKGGIYYALPEGWIGLQLLVQRLLFTPENMGQFLFLTSLFTPVLFNSQHVASFHSRLRWHKHWVLLFPLVLLISLIIIAMLTNTIVSSVTARNMIIVTPLLILILAIGLRLLPIQASLIILAILYINVPQHMRVPTSNGPYREIIASMVTNYQTDSIVLTEFSSAWRWLTPSAYFLMDFTPDHMAKTRMFHFVDPDDNVYTAGNFPELLTNIYHRLDENTLDQIIPTASQLWLLQQGDGNSHHANLTQWLNNHYAQIRQNTWQDGYPTRYTLTEYARVPDDANLMLKADDNFELWTWTLNDSVDVLPCQPITVESWWQIEESSDNPYDITLILADDNGQVAINEQTPANLFTTEWEANRYYRDANTLTIPCDIAVGSYNLLLGMKNSITGEALDLTYPDGNSMGTLYYLTTLTVQGS